MLINRLDIILLQRLHQQIACWLMQYNCIIAKDESKPNPCKSSNFAMYKAVKALILLSFVQLYHMVFRPFILVSTPASTQCWLSHRGRRLGPAFYHVVSLVNPCGRPCGRSLCSLLALAHLISRNKYGVCTYSRWISKYYEQAWIQAWIRAPRSYIKPALLSRASTCIFYGPLAQWDCCPIECPIATASL